MDPDPAIFVIGLQDTSKKLIFNTIFNTIFSACYFFKVYLHYFSKIKSQKESQNSRIQGFSYHFCMMIVDPDPEPDPYLWLVDPDPGGQKTSVADPDLGIGAL